MLFSHISLSSLYLITFVCNLIKDTASYAQYIAPADWIMNWKGSGRNQYWSNLVYEIGTICEFHVRNQEAQESMPTWISTESPSGHPTPAKSEMQSLGRFIKYMELKILR